MLVNEFSGASFVCMPNSNSTCMESGEQILEFYQVSDVVVWEWALVLIGMTIGYHILTFLVIKYFHKEKR